MTCLETYATLRVFSPTLGPEDIGRVLELQATRDVPRDLGATYRTRRENHFWAWSSQGKVESQDGLVHIQQVIKQLEGKAEQISRLRSDGCEFDICCYWVSSGQGGPFLDVPTLRALAELQVEIWWDVYFGSEEDYAEVDPENTSAGVA